MTFSPGASLGSYALLSPLGAGGMGEVYRATDRKLGRDVAIKVLPAEVAQDAERLARFRREAQLLASLNHANIAAIHGLEESDGKPFLVLELVEGETLQERIARGPISVEEALPVARQIAEALEEAHEHGIVHRDLKPANVKLTAEGKVKVLDFGLAKAYAGDGDSEKSDLSHSPTLTRQGTEAGVILGTAAYMSPEQARGKRVDKRADIWAFGVVLFEMLTGTRLFHGETVSDTLAAVLKTDPDWRLLPAETPRRVRELLRHCLERNPKNRLHDIADARVSLEEALAGVAEEPVAPAPAGPLWRRALVWPVAALIGAVLALWAMWRPAHGPATPQRLSLELGADASLSFGGTAAILSPDGRVLAFVARRAASEKSQLYVRRLDELKASPLSGTEDASDPFFSPDGQWIAFFADSRLKKISVSGGAAVTLCDAPDERGGSWSEDGSIVFAPQKSAGLSRVSSAGGVPEALTRLDSAERTHRWPQVLPGGKAVLFTAHNKVLNLSGLSDATIVVQSLPNGPRKILHQGGVHGRYLPSGHLVYVQGGTLFAAPFDLGRLELSGGGVPALEGIRIDADLYAQFAFAGNGTIVYAPAVGDVSVLWMDRDGKTQPLRAVSGAYTTLRFSPDGSRLALALTAGQEKDVWVYDWGRDTMSRLTFDPSEDTAPVWTPDGRRIAFASARGDKATTNLYWQRADGTGEVERLTESPNRQNPKSWHPSGRFLAYIELNAQGDYKIMILPFEGDEASGLKPGKPAPFLNSPFYEAAPAFSPDGRWLAYFSIESGRGEVYVRPFPGPGGKWQISTGGGRWPT